ncbi:class I SAM-dependent methyltransferase [Agrobacterium rubi]|nr:class I SAM-dependent methyltransferase [Agrobacterium rubi]NTF24072.1 class I SAM-dependent methyltransferase [Agrobacterium rubi]
MTQTIELDGHSLITPHAINVELFNDISQDLSGKQAKAELVADLDRAQDEFARGLSPRSIGTWLTLRLHEIRNSLDPDIWRTLIPVAQNHPVAQYFHQDPLTKWSWDKPRGYSGDAHLLDLIYRDDKIAHHVSDATDIGRELFEFTSTAPSSLANWDRRDILARKVDEIAASRDEAISVLSFAAGHLREAAVSEAFKAGKVSKWVAVDQDPLSMAEVKASYEGSSVESSTGNIRDLLANRLNLGTHDFVYASGLYDYLNDKIAIKTTQRLLNLVKPGGTFLFANYSYPIVVDGYLETFMNWTLLLRSEEDMWRVIRESGSEDEWESSVFFGHERNIAYGVMRRKA